MIAKPHYTHERHPSGELYACPIGAACHDQQPIHGILHAMELARKTFDVSTEFLDGVITGFDYVIPLETLEGDEPTGYKVGREMRERWVK